MKQRDKLSNNHLHYNIIYTTLIWDGAFPSLRDRRALPWLLPGRRVSGRNSHKIDPLERFVAIYTFALHPSYVLCSALYTYSIVLREQSVRPGVSTSHTSTSGMRTHKLRNMKPRKLTTPL